MDIEKKILQGWKNSKKKSGNLKILQPPHQKSNGPPLTTSLLSLCLQTAVFLVWISIIYQDTIDVLAFAADGNFPLITCGY